MWNSQKGSKGGKSQINCKYKCCWPCFLRYVFAVQFSNLVRALVCWPFVVSVDAIDLLVTETSPQWHGCDTPVRSSCPPTGHQPYLMLRWPSPHFPSHSAPCFFFLGFESIFSSDFCLLFPRDDDTYVFLVNGMFLAVNSDHHQTGPTARLNSLADKYFCGGCLFRPFWTATKWPHRTRLHTFLFSNLCKDIIHSLVPYPDLNLLNYIITF